MDKSLKGTRTEQNLLKAFAGESQARNRYEFFAKQAQNEGYEQVAAMCMRAPKRQTNAPPVCIRKPSLKSWRKTTEAPTRGA